MLLFQNQSLFRKGQCLNAPEIKILFSSVVYITAGVFVLGRYGQSVSTHDTLINSLLSFGVCQLNGNDPSCPDHEDIVNKTNISLNCITFFILGLIPLTSLSYAVKTSDIKRLFQRLRLSSKKSRAFRSTSTDSRKKDSVLTNATVQCSRTQE